MTVLELIEYLNTLPDKTKEAELVIALCDNSESLISSVTVTNLVIVPDRESIPIRQALMTVKTY